MSTVSTQPPNLKPTDRSVPTSRKPRLRWSAIEPVLPLSPTIASICCHGPASQRPTTSVSSAFPIPRPPSPAATYTESSTVYR